MGSALVSDLLAFFTDRLKVILKEQGARHDLIEAVAGTGEDDLVRLVARVKALEGFLGTEDGANLLAAYRRAVNIVLKEEKKDKTAYGGAPDASLLRDEAEKTLAARLAATRDSVQRHYRQEAFAEAMREVATLRAPVDAFFAKVTVNAEDAALRANRLRLLASIRDLLNGVADFGKVEG